MTSIQTPPYSCPSPLASKPFTIQMWTRHEMHRGWHLIEHTLAARISTWLWSPDQSIEIAITLDVVKLLMHVTPFLWCLGTLGLLS